MFLYGAKDQDRTGDPSLFRGMLYQLSYLGKSYFRYPFRVSNVLCALFILFSTPWMLPESLL